MRANKEQAIDRQNNNELFCSSATQLVGRKLKILYQKSKNYSFPEKKQVI